jgi:hypothetical protein
VAVIMANADELRDAAPWHPMSETIDLKILGKLVEELAECISAVGRCQIQGIDESEPVTGKVNRAWLEDEMADVLNMFKIATRRYCLDTDRIERRAEKKRAHIEQWLKMP